MTTPLLATKLHIPSPRPNLVSRPRLVNQLNICSDRKLILISAPAGFGKSTLLSACIQQIENHIQVAWLSLDEGDNDLNRFLTYFVAALQTIEMDIGQGVLAALQSPGSVNTEAVLTNLLNEILNFSSDVVLILDDYHVIETPEIDQAITFLLEHFPTQMHLVISSRIDPSLPLSRLRARGQMAEIRANDLRFTLDEADAFLNQVVGLNLSSQDVTAMGKRTEGWIAGLQLAALSLQGFERSSDITNFIDQFTGSDRYIQDYLADEVLQQQPNEIRDFLLQTSILRRMSSSLCDAVTQKNNSQSILKILETANLFIQPLDNQRQWYRYHHLFADLLRHRLMLTSPDQVSELHRRASRWYQNAASIDDAIQHSQASGDPERLAKTLENFWQVLIHQGQFAELKSLLDSLGPKITKNSAPLSMAYCWIYAMTENYDPIASHIDDIRNALNTGERTDSSLLPSRVAVIPSLIETMEAILALNKDQAEKAKNHAIKAISFIPDILPPESRGLLGGAAGYRLAEAHLKLGELDEAYHVLLEVLEMLKTSANYYGAVATLQQIVSIYQKLGKIDEAINLCEDMLQFMKDNHWGEMPPSGVANVILAEVQVDSRNFYEARKNLETGRRIVKPIESPQILRHITRVEEKLEANTVVSQPLVEPLSDRELEVLQLIAQGLSNREISERLFLALDTIKGHNRRIFGKLGVKNRAQAINKAISLKIIPPQ